MTEAKEVEFRRLTQWLTAGVVAVGLAAACFTGSGVAWADDGSTSNGGTDSPVSTTTDRPTTLPAGIRIADRTLNNVNSRDEMESLRLQMAMHRLSKLTSTLSNVLKNASETAQNITQNIK
jgi:hypothetical protein